MGGAMSPAGWSCSGLLPGLGGDGAQAMADPLHHRDGHCVAEHPVADAVRERATISAAGGPAVGEALQALALCGGEASDHQLVVAGWGEGEQVPPGGVEGVAGAAVAPVQRRPATGLEHVHRPRVRTRARWHGWGRRCQRRAADPDGAVDSFLVALSVRVVSWACAIRRSAWCRAGGSSRLRGWAARRSTCRALLAIKQYLEGTRGSTMARNKDAASLLREAVVLRVQHRPRQAVPELAQGVEDRLEVLALVAVQQPGDVLKQKPPRA